VQLPEEFLQKVSRLGDKTDGIVANVLRAGAEVVLAKVKTNLQAVIGQGTKTESRSTGALAAALGVSGARMDRDGNANVKVGFSEPRRDARGSDSGGSNAMIANILEYGKHGQPPKPFLKPAQSAAKDACMEAMKTKLEGEINKT
jgi:HK97 gp10 family phage protein